MKHLEQPPDIVPCSGIQKYQISRNLEVDLMKKTASKFSRFEVFDK